MGQLDRPSGVVCHGIAWQSAEEGIVHVTKSTASMLPLNSVHHSSHPQHIPILRSPIHNQVFRLSSLPHVDTLNLVMYPLYPLVL
ncbi:hypothetical protein PCASD_14313 [Puccinia coronata f. sp. avenae]|uniref:Uncharacterized protein n=1 Tax=Puccinia coronata f. sp. avenae TaxID=200324 RepID=A0A2N5U9J8_9BASI|nr:hypothetical protein PCASD_22749 [Puccinia coronata f. sp. avenae]PLW34413.1 hypothetical protein PCASD_14313 [Puccinia coronata f. sp. avenae]